MKFPKKSISYILVVAMVFIVLVGLSSTAFAYTQGELIRDSASIDAWVTWMGNNTHGSNIVDLKPSYWNVIDQCFSAAGCGSLSSYTELQNAMETWNGRMHRFDVMNVLALSIFCLATSSKDVPTAYIAFDSQLGVYRFREYHTDLWLVNSSGHFPFYEPPKGEDGNVPAVDNTGIQWLPYKDAFQDQNNRHFVTKDVLDDMSAYYKGVVIKQDKYYVITTTDPVLGGYLYLCDPHGYPYVNVIDPESTAINTPNNYFDSSGSTTNNQLLVDLIQNVTWFPDGTMQYIDSVIYDESTQSYYVDSHDTYNFVNDSYNTYNYHWEYNYYIDYTSITYIGDTEEYEDPFECYYELPDGRSSADLTKEELEQISLNFVDVINYARSADDVNMRVLYHFDGNTDDSSYWSYCTKFDWVEGASLTYMDEGTFNGSLYLDETDHKFTITLPNNDMGGDFTFQFRYYQSYTAAPVTDGIISFGFVDVMKIDGGAFYNRDGVALCPVPIGSWNEICFVRQEGILYYYINGICYGQLSSLGGFGGTITFSFGSKQQTYKKLDEMRFTKGAVYTAPDDYTPTAVPFDTNLALVLPDGEVPVADEYCVIVPAEGNILSRYDFTDLSTLSVSEFNWGGFSSTNFLNTKAHVQSLFSYLNFYTFDNTVSLTQGEQGVVLSVSDTSPGSVSSKSLSAANYIYNYVPNCLNLNLCSGLLSNGNTLGEFDILGLGYRPSRDRCFTLTVVDVGGNTSYITFGFDWMSARLYCFGYECSTVGFVGNISQGPEASLGKLSFSDTRGQSFDGPLFVGIYPLSGSVEIAYMELVEGDAPQFELEWHSAVYSSGQLEDSPVLAVKSNTEVTSWQIGGVRPSYPERGQVYALVENGRITSLQQYTGYAWIAVDGRIWTGERWIPPASFDVFTLKDFWDVVGNTNNDYTYIYTESGFWDWWQKQWLSFTDKLFSRDSGSGSGSVTNTDITINIENDILLDEEDKRDFNENEYKGIVKTMRNIYDFVAGFFTDFTMSSIQDFLDVLNDKNSFVYGLFRLGGLG